MFCIPFLLERARPFNGNMNLRLGYSDTNVKMNNDLGTLLSTPYGTSDFQSRRAHDLAENGVLEVATCTCGRCQSGFLV